MASLTQVAITTRKTIRYGIYLTIILIIGRIFLGLGISLIQTIFPSPPPPPTVQFGKLPKLPFPQKTVNTNITYNLQIPEGNLPTLASQAKVYFMPQSRADLLALDNAKTKAQNLGFNQNPTQITQTLYDFAKDQSSSILEMNIITNTFTLGFNLNTDQSPLTNRPPTPTDSATTAKNFLSTGGLLPDDLTGPVTQEYLKVENKKIVSAISLSEANLTRINLFRKDYDKLPSLPPDINKANVWFVISGSQDQGKQIVGAQFYYYPVDETQYATYPLITSQEAFEELKNGKGYISNLGNNANGKVTIRRVYLAYYDPDAPTQFYQPIIVFEGDNGFVAYVPAVTGTFYSE